MTADQRRKQRDQLIRHRLQSLLADRFQLELRSDSKAGQTYALRIPRNGHKLKPGTGESSVRGGDFRLTAENATKEMFATELTGLLGRPVADKTGLTGGFNFKLDWSPLGDGRGAKASQPADRK